MGGVWWRGGNFPLRKIRNLELEAKLFLPHIALSAPACFFQPHHNWHYFFFYLLKKWLAPSVDNACGCVCFSPWLQQAVLSGKGHSWRAWGAEIRCLIVLGFKKQILVSLLTRSSNFKRSLCKSQNSERAVFSWHPMVALVNLMHTQ